MKRILVSFLVMGLSLAAASVAFGQPHFYCVKPDGAPVAGIVLPGGARHDPSVVCNAVVPQCFLTCGAVQRIQSGGGTAPPPEVPIVNVTPAMLANLGGAANESPQYCESQYQACLANCRGNTDCRAYCQSVRSGCGTAGQGR